MKKLFTGLLFILAFSSIIYGQSWKPTYSVAYNLDLAIHGYDDWDLNNPWKVAEELFKPTSYTEGYKVDDIDGMSVKDWPQYKDPGNHSLGIDPLWRTILTKTMEFDFFSDHIQISQNQCALTSSTNFNNNPRVLAKIYFLNSSGSKVNLGPFKQNDVPFKETNGRIFVQSDNFAFRVNCDGLLMVKVINKSVVKIQTCFNFYPGYKASSPKIPHNLRQGEYWDIAKEQPYNKEDVSHVFMDEYGGIGFYLLEDENEYYDTGCEKPEVRYNISSLVQRNKIFWISAFPPKIYDYDKDYHYSSSAGKQVPNRSAFASISSEFASWYYFNYSPYKFDDVYRLKNFNWNFYHAYPMNTYFFVSNSKPFALQEYISNSQCVNLENGIMIHHDCISLWKDWLFDYKPRAFLGSDEYGILNQIRQNLAPQNTKYIVYTSPQYFIKGTHYNPLDDVSPYQPYYSSSPIFTSSNQITCDDVVYNTIKDNPGNFLINGDKKVDFGDGQLRRNLILNNMDQYCADGQKGTTNVDKLVKEFNSVQGCMIPLNREGENMEAYITAVSNLTTGGTSTNPNIDGVFMDTPYEFNIPRTYQLMRELRKNDKTKNFTLMFHESARAGQDAYLPQIDAYADYIVNGEFNKNNDFYDRQLWRYFISTMNISNTPSLILTPETISETSTTDGNFFRWCYDYNIKLMYRSIPNTTENSSLTKARDLVNSFFSSFPDRTGVYSIENRVNTNLSKNQEQLVNNYNILGNEWTKDNAPASTNEAIYLKGDFDNNKKEDLVIVQGSNFNFISNDPLPASQTSFSVFPAVPINPFIGDFNADGKSDIGYFTSDNMLHIRFSNSNSKFIVSNGGREQDIKFFTTASSRVQPTDPIDIWSPIQVSTIKQVIVGDLNNDNQSDLLFLFAGLMGRGTYLCPQIFCGTCFVGPNNIYATPISNSGTLFLEDILSDIPNCNKLELIELVGQVWKIYRFNINIFNNITSPYAINVGELEIKESLSINASRSGIGHIGNFDGSPRKDLCISYKVSDGSSFIFSISDGSLNFNSGYGKQIKYSSLSPKYFVLDFNGDGYDDFGVHFGTNIAIKINEPGSIYDPTKVSLKKSLTETISLPTEYNLSQNYPNPFNPTTTIKFDIPKVTRVSLKIYNVLGQEVETLVNEIMEPGAYNFKWDAGHFASGMYIYRIEAGDFVQSKKMMLIK